MCAYLNLGCLGLHLVSTEQVGAGESAGRIRERRHHVHGSAEDVGDGEQQDHYGLFVSGEVALHTFAVCVLIVVWQAELPPILSFTSRGGLPTKRLGFLVGRGGCSEGSWTANPAGAG
jgi:hypothetical protein